MESQGFLTKPKIAQHTLPGHYVKVNCQTGMRNDSAKSEKPFILSSHFWSSGLQLKGEGGGVWSMLIVFKQQIEVSFFFLEPFCEEVHLFYINIHKMTGRMKKL